MFTDAGRPVIFFDGVCNLCNRFVQFIIRHDKRKVFLFAALQSPAGEEARSALEKIHGEVPDTVVLFYKGVYYTRSEAGLRIYILLGGGWKMLHVLLWFPAFFRDWVYNLIARNRYRIWGIRDECMMPTEELRKRFL